MKSAAVWSVNPNLLGGRAYASGDLQQPLARTSFTLVMLAIAGAMALLLAWSEFTELFRIRFRTDVEQGDCVHYARVCSFDRFIDHRSQLA